MIYKEIIVKKLILAATLFTSISQAFSAASFLAGLHDKYIAAGGLLTSTTVSVAVSPLAGLVTFLENGEPYINLGSEEAQDALKIAVEKTVNGEELSEADSSIIAIVAESEGMTESEVISSVAAEL